MQNHQSGNLEHTTIIQLHRDKATEIFIIRQNSSRELHIADAVSHFINSGPGSSRTKEQ